MRKKVIKLEQLVKVDSGYAFKSKLFNEEKGMPIIRIRNVTKGNVTTYYTGVYEEKYIVYESDLLITMDGEFKIRKWLGPKALLNQRVCRINPNYEKINGEYLYYFMPKALKNIEVKTSFVTVKHLSIKDILDINIQLPPLETQKKIAQVLDKAQELIDRRKEQIEMLDEFIQSVFLDMFGDPVKNPKGWEIKKLNQITNKIGSGATPRGGKESYKSSGISLIRSMNVYDGFFKYEQLAYIDDTQAEKLNNVALEMKDVLINITGASVARCCSVPNNVLPARVNQHVCIVRVKDRIIDSCYLVRMFISRSYKIKLLSIGGAGGATREAITKNNIENLEIPIPPLQLQTQFAQIVQKSEQQKALLKESLTEMENNFNSLMQRAFKGELF